MQSLLILGRQPEFGLAELESLYGESKLRSLNDSAVLLDVDPCLVAFDRLGGSQKFCKVLTELNTVNWTDILEYIIKVTPEHSLRMPKGKMQLGLSLYGFNESIQKIHSYGLNLKKAIQATGRNVRLIQNFKPQLNAAQVIHNKLLYETGWELVFIKDKTKTVIAQTIKVQNIEAYAKRDQARPNRNIKSGILPPKLAQIIINCASGLLPEEARQSVCDTPPDKEIPLIKLNKTLLDPFCGSGVVLQESLLIGYDVIGSDISKVQIESSQENITWLKQNYKKLSESKVTIKLADARTAKWEKFDVVASETNLGKPLTASSPISEIEASAESCNKLIESFLINLSNQLNHGFRLCLAVPAWRIKNKIYKLPLIDHLSDLGYNLVQFSVIGDKDLIYFRPDQVVARNLLVLERR